MTSAGAALLAVACSTHRPSADASAAPPDIEVRGARGELELAMAPRSGAWSLRLPGQRAQIVRASAAGAEVLEDDRRVASLRPSAAGYLLEVEGGGPPMRVTIDGDRIDVIDARGVILVAVDGRTARDGASRTIHTIEPGGDRLLVVGPEGERLGTVHDLPAPSPREASAGGDRGDPGARRSRATWSPPPERATAVNVAAILAARALDPRARAALAAYLLSR